MMFDLLDYETTVGHLSIYYDAGHKFNIEINADDILQAIGEQLQRSHALLAVDGKWVAMQH